MGRGQGSESSATGATQRTEHRLPLHVLESPEGAREVLALARCCPVELTLRHPLRDQNGILRNKVFLEFEPGGKDEDAQALPLFLGEEEDSAPGGPHLVRKALFHHERRTVALPDGLLVLRPGGPAYAPVEAAKELLEEQDDITPTQERLVSKMRQEVPEHYRRLEQILGSISEEEHLPVVELLAELFERGYHEGGSEFLAQMIEQGGDVEVRQDSIYRQR